MEIHSSWQTQLELKTRKIKKKESKWTKQNMENKRNKSVVVKELNHAWIQTQEALMQMRGRKRNSGATRKHSCKCASGFSMQSNQQKTKTTPSYPQRPSINQPQSLSTALPMTKTTFSTNQKNTNKKEFCSKKPVGFTPNSVVIC